jgi:ABC-type Zn2+ transport system substrate-binding protein/surface adhesin
MPVGLVLVRAFLEPVVAKQRRHGSRDPEAHGERERDGERQRQEQVAGDAGHEEHRKEDHDGRDGRHQDGHRHFLRGQQHGLLAVLPRRQMAVDVLQLDDGVVDQPPDAERQDRPG